MRRAVTFVGAAFGGVAAFGLGIATDRLFLIGPAGDPLAFAGAVFGAGATVAASLFVARYQASAASRDRHRLLIEGIDEALGGARGLSLITSSSTADEITSAHNGFVRSMVWLRRLEKTLPADSVPIWKALHALEGMRKEDASKVEGAVSTAKLYPRDSGTTVADAADGLTKSLTLARAYLK